MSNTINERIYDFLKNHPPFSFIRRDVLLNVCKTIHVEYYDAGSVIFKQGESTSNRFYVVKDGAVELLNNIGGKEVLVDVCDEGDIFGIRPLISENEPYSLTGRVSEEALIYATPIEIFKKVLHDNEQVKEFFDTSFAAGIRNPYAKYSRYKLHDPCNENLIAVDDLLETQNLSLEKEIISCSKTSTIKDAAKTMRDRNVGSMIIVNELNHPIGIFTDRDLRNKVSTGEISIDEPIPSIMNSPVITISPSSTIADIQIEMVKNNVHHLCVTKDGTDKSPVTGIVSEHDILLAHGNDPSVLLRQIKRSENAEQLVFIRTKTAELLKKYMRQEVSISYISRIISEINNSITIRAIQFALNSLTEKGIQRPDVSWCWLAIGSQGREEQLLNTDQDNAIVFEDVSENEYDQTKKFFISLAEIVNEILLSCGFQYCPSEMMARNPKWCLSLSEWKQQFSDWIYTPGEKEVMFTTIFFDYSPIYGDEKLAEEMSSFINTSINKQKSFLSFLAKNALQNPPPLSFFRSLMVESNGEHKDEFDIKARAMMPIVDGARVLALQNGLTHLTNTIKRYKKLAEIEPENADLFNSLAEQYELLIRFRTMQGLKHKNSGRFFKPDELNKMQRMMLKNSFTPIKDLQSLLTTRFQLNQFR